jgi:hypothetical protein
MNTYPLVITQWGRDNGILLELQLNLRDVSIYLSIMQLHKDCMNESTAIYETGGRPMWTYYRNRATCAILAVFMSFT